MKLLHPALKVRLLYMSPLGHHQLALWLPGDTAAGEAQIDLGERIERELPVDAFRSEIAPLRVGRFYPKQLLTIADAPAPMFRVLRVEGDRFTADFSHPLQSRVFKVESSPSDMSAEPVGKLDQLLQWAGMEASLDAPTDFSAPDAFARDDETPDTEFYDQPRKLIHVDAVCARRIQALYRTVLPPKARVLDLMASWRSHLPDTVTPAVGLGMNAEEMADNPQLAERIVHDLNAEPRLPFADASFDAAVCTVSFEYLTRPQAVIAEVRRVLKPGGVFVVTLSHRYFPPKVIHLWTQLHPMERMAWVGNLLAGAGFDRIKTYVEHGLKRPKDDRYADRLPESDPLFATWGVAP
ncbi:MAG: methyltransferase domain-containing protein [Gammaproteobacteria bacterium]